MWRLKPVFAGGYCRVVTVLILILAQYHGHGDDGSSALAEKVEYVRLPLLTLQGSETGAVSKIAAISPLQLENGAVLKEQSRSAGIDKRPFDSAAVRNRTTLDLTELLDKLTGRSEEVEEDVDQISEESPSVSGSVSKNKQAVDNKVDGGGDVSDNERKKGKVVEEIDYQEEIVDGDSGIDDDDQFNELDLIDLVQELEHQADMEEQKGIFPEILDILHGSQNKQKNQVDDSPNFVPTTMSTLEEEEDGIANITLYKSGVVSRTNGTLRISLNEDGDLQLGSDDLSQFSEEIVNGISEGIEESLRMSDDLELYEDILPNGDNTTAETRQFSVYLFQGQYYAEPRLNRFIDGAIRNMGTELRVASMDPLYFRVLPRGQVVEREAPIVGIGASANAIRRRRPGFGGGGGGVGIGPLGVGRHARSKRQLPSFFRPQAKKNKGPGKQADAKKQLSRKAPTAAPSQQRGTANRFTTGIQRITNFGGGLLAKRRQQQRLQRQRKRRQQRIRQQRIKQQLKNRRKKQQQKNKNKLNNANKQQLLNRIRRRIRQDVGGGRIEGLSRVTRDGDAEMQLFGNYTLIRSHMKMGPVEITMQFRTKNGIRRSGATLPAIRAHTVTRVNHEGSEMIDYLLDRPHPEAINVRGSIFPLAQRVARNVFARLFLPNSFLTSKLREKASLAFLSKPVVGKKR